MADIPADSFVDAFLKTVELIVKEPATATLSVVGLLLLFLAAGLSYLALTKKPEEVTRLLVVSLFVSLVGGMVFSAAGPGLALFWVSKSPIKKVPVAEAFKNLEGNSRVKWLIRLVQYDPIHQPELAVGKLDHLGPEQQQYSFVGDYDELVGYTAREALEKIGASYDPAKTRVSAIIFPLAMATRNLYPANARGLLQVVQNVEKSKAEIKERLLDGTILNTAELKDLTNVGMDSYQVTKFSEKYPHYCELTIKLQSGNYSAKDYIGGLYADWHPLGFSRRNPDENVCNGGRCCVFSDWKQAETAWQAQFGSRAFLVDNLQIDQIPGRVMIDFDQPQFETIPDVRPMVPDARLNAN